ncbi:ABC transporter ATP-binding protein [Parafrankia sp. FMc2]|uniref:ABC transporter ATP-binding protein n=1 Tax=Parafrankia sp. FMc2 TaxID=3233196 RepID=UPI0034D67F01
MTADGVVTTAPGGAGAARDGDVAPAPGPAEGAAATMVIAGLSVTLAGASVLRGVELTVRAGELLGVVGPNGAGKSTLLRCLYRSLRPTTGAVTVNGRDLLALDAAASARVTAALPQEPETVTGLSVRHVVELGRLPHRRRWAPAGPADAAIVEEAMRRVGVEELASRDIGELSGGERQRVLLARALAQQPQVLVLDEPLNHLDVRHQLDALELVRDLGITTVLAVHDLGLALRYCDRIAVLDRGSVVACGPPGTVLDTDLMATVFGVDARILDLGEGRRALWCEPRRPLTAASPPEEGDL